jgi:hypothetical protein
VEVGTELRDAQYLDHATAPHAYRPNFGLPQIDSLSAWIRTEAGDQCRQNTPGAKDDILLRCGAMESGGKLPTFRWNLLPPSSGQNFTYTLKVEAAGSFETLITFY